MRSAEALADVAADPTADPRYRRLLAAAHRAAANGYDAVSMRDLAAETRMSLAKIYELVGSKDELIARAHAGGMEHLRDEVARRPPRGRTAEARVRAVLRRFADALEHDEVRTRALMRALYSTEQRVAASRGSVGVSFTAMIDAAIGDADVADRYDVIDVLGHVVNSVILSWLNGRLDHAGVRRTLDRSVRTLFHGR
jgi:AcrR family transcriptional regulator